MGRDRVGEDNVGERETEDIRDKKKWPLIPAAPAKYFNSNCSLRSNFLGAGDGLIRS